MINKFRAAAAVLSCALIVCAGGCGDDGKNTDSMAAFSTVSIAWELPQADELRREIVGSWGRLGEVMHEFYSDNTCVIGGMFGDYEIADSGSLILTTTSGSKTEYIYGESTAENYWQLDGDTLTVNGNRFSRIEETEDEIKN